MSFQEGKGNVQVFLRSCGGTRTNIKINGWMWSESIVRTMVYLRVVHEDEVPLTVHLYLLLIKRKLNGLWERNVGESLQQGQHVVFNDRNECRTHLSPNVHLQIRCSCGAHQAAKYTTTRDLERETPTVVQFWYAVNGTR